MVDLVTILKSAVQQGASDIHICVGKPPMMRHHGEIKPVADALTPLTAEQTKGLIFSALYDEQRAKFENNWELDCSFAITGISRFRLNVLIARNGVEAVMRVIPSVIPTPEQLSLTPAITGLINLPRGLVLVTGPTGSGKTTTLACMLEMINQKKHGHILTTEDPIEFTYESKQCIIRQREIGQHTKGFNNALRAALREDPNVILVGEMRDLETIQLTITAAETGHLCFATLHTQDAPSTVDRIIDVFPPHQQMQVRVQLASSLEAVVSQILLPRKDGKGRIAAREIMIMTPAISNLIREGKTHMIYSAIETGAKFGMIPMDRSLANLVLQGLVAYDVAASKVHDLETFKKLCNVTV
ncbi:MAG: type IV pilus twitching motility protein PilT [Elusimicrobia bacterium]|nr:type IV pilus twitching motility protein PilT [Elusimicrobiota bacterium]